MLARFSCQKHCHPTYGGVALEPADVGPVSLRARPTSSATRCAARPAAVATAEPRAALESGPPVGPRRIR
jgi:hypothetical protein